MSENPQEEAQLHALGEKFMAAIQARNSGDLESAEAYSKNFLNIVRNLHSNSVSLALP